MIDSRLDLAVILEEALGAALAGAKEAALSRDAFDEGRLMAYYDVLTVAAEHADLLGVPREQLGLRGVSLDALLKHREAA